MESGQFVRIKESFLPTDLFTNKPSLQGTQGSVTSEDSYKHLAQHTYSPTYLPPSCYSADCQGQKNIC